METDMENLEHGNEMIVVNSDLDVNVSFNEIQSAVTLTNADMIRHLCRKNNNNVSQDIFVAYNMSGRNCSTIENTLQLPRDMRFNEDSLVSILAYSFLFIVASVGNLTVFVTLFRNRHRKSRVNLFIMHLAIADLFVTFIVLPLEIAWHMTVSWQAGDTACRTLLFFRAFGFYLSSFILVTISLDRYFAIMHPLSLKDGERRGKVMLVFAWVCSIIASTPQSFIFHVEAHPEFPDYTQCVTFNFFPSEKHELAYNLFVLIAIYVLPLIVITFAYSMILFEITKKSRESQEETCSLAQKTETRLRRSGIGNIERARIRTLKMTVMIVLVFLVCWTPYFVMSCLWWFDSENARKVDPKIQRGLFIFAVSNSCMDPIVYGFYMIDFKREFRRCCCCLRSNYQDAVIYGNARTYTKTPIPLVLNDLSDVGRYGSGDGSQINNSNDPLIQRSNGSLWCKQDCMDNHRLSHSEFMNSLGSHIEQSPYKIHYKSGRCNNNSSISSSSTHDISVDDADFSSTHCRPSARRKGFNDFV
ncbi:unnamed protein product [Owenia fusiformis]|uniref:G-protein coupled receptors family 1 profile domain-containing protein n=1 Tax=Owenia fusiformis TaxID=6347 RepID=A0A8S4PVZ7_OWEFU|nr:unnamed protein product [Owenia fusiformis]